MNRTNSLATAALMAMAPAMMCLAGAEAPQPATDKKQIEKCPGLYLVARHGIDVGDVYLVLTPEPVLIDCGSRVGWEQLAGNLKLLGLSPGDVRWVIATHGHWDHMDAMAIFQRDFPGVKFAIHAGDAQFVIVNDRVFSCADPLYNGAPSNPVKVDRILLDGDIIAVGNKKFRIIHTPGHTPGSVSIVTEIDGKKIAFCGDSVGGYYALINRSSVIDWQISLRKLLATDLDHLYIGHGGMPFVGRERIRELLQTSLDAVTYKREQQKHDECYQDLVDGMRKKR